MKKLFTSVLLVLSALTMQAEDYTGNLNIIVPDMEIDTNQDASISVTAQQDGNYELKIENFNFDGIPVGTIDVKDVKATRGENGLTILYFNGNTVIQDSEQGGILVGSTVDIDLKGMLTSVGFRANIDIVAENDGTPLPVTVNFTPDGKAAQIPNSDFENFHTATYSKYSSTEADHWHSFTSAKASGWYVAARMGKQSEESTDVREGTSGTKCLKITSAIIAGQTANGTVTTGRLNAGAMSAKDTKNHAFLDLSNTDVDDNGDPFYTTLETMPDAIEFYCRFKQGQDNLSNKYASMRAVITDGTYYQDPEDKTYTNIVAVAANKKIEGTDVWQKVTEKFDYETYAKNEKDPKAILVTISTNSEPGVASSDKDNPDYIYIDDLRLIYNANLTSLRFMGEELFQEGKTEYSVNTVGPVSLDDIWVMSDGIGAYETTSLEEVEGGCKATITITSEDLKTQNVYVLNIKGGTVTGINKHQATTFQNGTKAIYNLAGQQVGDMSKAGVYIIERTDGSTVKVLKK